jgi:hypothetical protein
MQRDSSLSQKMTKQKGMRLSLEVIFATLTDQSTVRYFIINKEITGWEYDPDKIVPRQQNL